MPDQAGRIMDVELLHQIRPVGIDGAEAQTECIRHLAVGVSAGDVLQDFGLPCGKYRRSGLPFGAAARPTIPGAFHESFDDDAGYPRTEEPVAGHGRSYCRKDLPAGVL